METASQRVRTETLTLPGWQNSGPQHWQSRWEAALGFQRVEQHDWQRPLRGDWITRLEEVVLRIPAAQPIRLVAHSLGCHLVAAWAAVSRGTGRVRGALLVAPPDLNQADFPAELHSWRRFEAVRLPFAATCVTSCNDPFDRAQAGVRMAAAWGAR
ncbi:MAG: hypothetical protein RLZZ126_1801, partial [Pseudomonadota bacterium]